MQTAGELLGWHPHVHLLVTDGGFLADGSFRHLLWVDVEALERLWRAEVLRLLVKRGKIGQEVVESLLSWRHSGFSVHAGVRVEEKAAAARLGRYMARCPIVLDRLEWDVQREEVVVHARPSRRGGPLGESERLDVLSFLARVLDHVPEPRQQQVRYWGWYSNAARGKRRKAESGSESESRPVSADVEPSGASRYRRLSWARLIRKVYEVGPVVVPVLRRGDEDRGLRGGSVVVAAVAGGCGALSSGGRAVVAGASRGGGAGVRSGAGLTLSPGRSRSLAELCSVERMGGRFRLGEAPRGLLAEGRGASTGR